MKKVVLTIFSAFALLTSCQDAYEIDQPGYVTDGSEVFTDVASVERALAGIYGMLNTETRIKFETVFSDEVGLGVNNGGAGINDGSYNFVLLSTNDYAQSIWYGNYTAINNINRLFRVIDGLIVKEEAGSPNRQRFEKAKAELYGIRAYCNLVLFSYFTPDYTNANGLSIMKLDYEHTDFNVTIPRSNVADIKKFIEDDIAESNKYFGAQGYNIAENQLITKGALDAMLVKLYSMTEDYDNVISIATNIVGSNVHTFATGNDYGLMYHVKDFFDTKDDANVWVNGEGKQQNNAEIIFQLVRSVNQSYAISDIWYTNQIGSSGNTSFEMGRSLYNEFDKLDPTKTGQPVYDPEKTNEFGIPYHIYLERSDIRFKTNLFSDSEAKANYASLGQTAYIANDRLYIGKYREKAQNRMQANMMVFRYTDIVLALAEARAAKGQITGAVADGDFSNVESIIYNVRKARLNPDSEVTEPNGLPTITNAQSAWKAILNERRMEFAFEGHRYLDVKRIGAKAGEGFKRDPKDCERNGACELAPRDYKLTLPIPRNEMLSNAKIVQNPGY